MAKVTLIGKIFPDCYKIDFSHNPLDWLWQEENLKLTFHIRIIQSEVEVDCTLDRYSPDFVTEIHKRSWDLTRSALNLYSFTSGIGFQLVFTEFVDDSSARSYFATQDSSLAALCNSISRDANNKALSFDQGWDMLISDPALFRALDDLIVSITTPHQSTINCARVVEGIRHIISGPNVNVKDSWQEMRSALKLDRSYLQLITDTSTQPRHGNHEFISGTVATEVLKRSWTIMDRLFEYLKRGKSHLAVADFPVLTG